MEELMREALKKTLVGLTEAAGIEIPGLPVDVGSVGECATTAVQDATDAAATAIDGVTDATDAITGLPLGDILPK
jgi:hypothetical protein